ncbi:MAG: hypothetical protein HZA83_00055 [Thaumarchaeota archaeon]|nr:hypothetical protein [Nitrososphaerota archaeon]
MEEQTKLPNTPKKSNLHLMVVVLVVVLFLLIAGGLAAYYLGYLGPFLEPTHKFEVEKQKAYAARAIEIAVKAVDSARFAGANVTSSSKLLAEAQYEFNNGDYALAVKSADTAAAEAKKARQEAEQKKNSADDEMPPPLPDE